MKNHTTQHLHYDDTFGDCTYSFHISIIVLEIAHTVFDSTSPMTAHTVFTFGDCTYSFHISMKNHTTQHLWQFSHTWSSQHKHNCSGDCTYSFWQQKFRKCIFVSNTENKNHQKIWVHIWVPLYNLGTSIQGGVYKVVHIWVHRKQIQFGYISVIHFSE